MAKQTCPPPIQMQKSNTLARISLIPVPQVIKNQKQLDDQMKLLQLAHYNFAV